VPSTASAFPTVTTVTAVSDAVASSGATTRCHRLAGSSGRRRKKPTTARDVAVISSRTPTAPTYDSQVNSSVSGSRPSTANTSTVTAAASDWMSDPATGAADPLPVRTSRTGRTRSRDIANT